MSEVAALDCNPYVDDFCEPAPLFWYHHETLEGLVTIVLVSFINMAFPAIYYSLSLDFNSAYYKDHPEQIPKNSSYSYQRNRGSIDDRIWYGISLAHSYLWGSSFWLFALSTFGFLEWLFPLYIEYFISNLNWIVYGGSVGALVYNARVGRVM